MTETKTEVPEMTASGALERLGAFGMETERFIHELRVYVDRARVEQEVLLKEFRETEDQLGQAELSIVELKVIPSDIARALREVLDRTSDVALLRGRLERFLEVLQRESELVAAETIIDIDGSFLVAQALR